MKENKKILLSGKLSGSRTFSSELEQIENPDEIEKFLLYFSELKISNSQLKSKEIINIDNEKHFLEINNIISQSKYISIHSTENFSKLYITTDTQKTVIISLENISPALISNIISAEQPTKYAINSFSFIKWCNSKNIEIKNLFDIPIFIKLLTNDVDPFKTVDNYLYQYTDLAYDNTISNTEKHEEETAEKNLIKIFSNEDKNVIISNFILSFGNLLFQYIEKFDLAIVSKLINENSYFEGNSFNNSGNCIITLHLENVNAAIANISESITNEYSNKAYIVSPLNRIAPKFKQDISTLIYEIYAEDLSITLLNELYNNNIPVKLDEETNKYIITCKFKNFSNIISLLTAIFTETFYTLFEQSPEIHIECFVKE